MREDLRNETTDEKVKRLLSWDPDETVRRLLGKTETVDDQKLLRYAEAARQACAVAERYGKWGIKNKKKEDKNDGTVWKKEHAGKGK